MGFLVRVVIRGEDRRNRKRGFGFGVRLAAGW